MLNSIKAMCLRWAAPLLEATPKQRIRWLLENSYLRERCSQTREHPRFLFT